MSDPNNDEKKQLLLLVKQAVQQDFELREQFKIGTKFRFIRDRLEALLTKVQEELTEIEKQEEKKQDIVLPEETLVYVYLFNAQGNVFPTWQKMFHPSVFYEYSINRPIYANQSELEALIRRKPNRLQHGFLTIAVKKQDILPGEPLKDASGNTLFKVREGALKIDRLMGFSHNGNEYMRLESGELVKKQ